MSKQDTNKKRVRRRRAPVEKIIKKTPESNEVKTELIKPEDNSVIKVVNYNYDNIDRLNSIPKFNSLVRQGIITDIIGKYMTYTIEQLNEESRNDKLPVFERMIMEQIADALRNIGTPTGSKNAIYLQERVAGKVKDIVEHSGIDGKAIQIEHGRIEQEIDDLLADMTNEEVEEYEKLMKRRLELEEKVRARQNE